MSIFIFLVYKLEELDDQILPIVLFLGLCVWFGVDNGYGVGCLHHVEDSCAVAAREEQAASTFRVASDPNVQRVPTYISSQCLQQTVMTLLCHPGQPQPLCPYICLGNFGGNFQISCKDGECEMF